MYRAAILEIKCFCGLNKPFQDFQQAEQDMDFKFFAKTGAGSGEARSNQTCRV